MDYLPILSTVAQVDATLLVALAVEARVIRREAMLRLAGGLATTSMSATLALVFALTATRSAVAAVSTVASCVLAVLFVAWLAADVLVVERLEDFVAPLRVRRKARELALLAEAGAKLREAGVEAGAIERALRDLSQPGSGSPD